MSAILSTRASDKLAIASTLAIEVKDYSGSDQIILGELNKTVKLRVENQTSIKPQSMRRVLVVSTVQRLIYCEADEQLAR